jgi:hypothetical protein
MVSIFLRSTYKTFGGKMANHKRKRPKNKRSGCLCCKPHKGNGSKGKFCNQTVQEKKALEKDKELGI